MSSPFRFEDAELNVDRDKTHRKAPRSSQKVKKVNLDSKTKIDDPRAFKEVLVISNPGNVIITLPIRTISEGNCFEPWQKKHKRHRSQKNQVVLAITPIKRQIKLPCHIKLIRYAPRSLDSFENLPMSFKWIVDTLCAELTGDYRPGRADGDKRITLSCDQIKSKEYFIKIEISF